MTTTPLYHADLVKPFPLIHQGKVRDSFAIDDELNPVIEGRVRKMDCGQITDGAACVILAGEQAAAEHAAKQGLKLADLPRIKGWGHRSAPLKLEQKLAMSAGQPLLFPALELEGWWTNLDKASCTPDALIALYQRRGTSEQYHSEFKTDLDLERLPSGKFDTNALVLALAALAYNILRYIGQDTLIGPDAPIRKAVHRRRLRTVLQEIIYKAARLIRHGRRYVLRFGRGDPGYLALARCYARVNV